VGKTKEMIEKFNGAMIDRIEGHPGIILLMRKMNEIIELLTKWEKEGGVPHDHRSISGGKK
jgi:hypothetical protein